jgi:hypothetical protein
MAGILQTAATTTIRYPMSTPERTCIGAPE